MIPSHYAATEACPARILIVAFQGYFVSSAGTVPVQHRNEISRCRVEHVAATSLQQASRPFLGCTGVRVPRPVQQGLAGQVGTAALVPSCGWSWRRRPPGL